MRLMYRWIVIAFALCATLSGNVLAASNTPEDVVKAFVQALDANQIDKATAFFAGKDVPEAKRAKVVERVNKKLSQSAQEMQEKGGLSKVKIISSENSGKNDALIKIKIITKKVEEDKVPVTDFYMRIEDGDWKIHKTSELNY